MTYKAIAAEMGVTTERIRQIRVSAERKIREEKRRDQARERAAQLVTITIQRRELWLLLRALETYQIDILLKNRKCLEEDPDYSLTETLITKFRTIN